MVFEKQSPGIYALVILDGFGHAAFGPYNAIAQAKLSHFRTWAAHYPHTLLAASGQAVGLPAGYIGNSEVGHITIGAGRIVPQDLTRVFDLINSGHFFSDELLLTNFKKLAATGRALHVIGLLSDAGAHSHIEHLYAYLATAHKCGITNIHVHAILDGRDTPPRSAQLYLQDLSSFLQQLGCGTISSVHGRFFAMDRDHHWDRIQKSYAVLTSPTGPRYNTWQDALTDYYARNITDEFVPPTHIGTGGTIGTGDGIVFFNFRPERMRQLTASFCQTDFNEFPTQQLHLPFVITTTDFDHNTLRAQPLIKKWMVPHTLKDVLSDAGKRIFSIAETEKYAHVTYFFNGGKERTEPHEKDVLIASISAKNYVDHPEMSAAGITQTVINSLEKDPYDFYLINYANADMVGHSGNFSATIKALEFLDAQLEQLYEVLVQQMNGTLIITGDHGKAEEMFDPLSNQAKTAHTSNPVPFIVINKKLKDSKLILPLQGLQDIAPFILKSMHIPIPPEMKR